MNYLYFFIKCFKIGLAEECIKGGLHIMGYITDQEQKQILSHNLSYYIDLSDKDQKEIAIELDINPPTLNQWVNGKAIPSVSLLKRLAAYFNIGLGDLVNSHDENAHLNDITPEEMRLIEAYRKAPSLIKTSVYKLLDISEKPFEKV